EYQVQNVQTQNLDYPLIPVQAPVPKLPGALEAAPFDMNSVVYARNQYISEPGVRIQDIDYMRGHRLVVLEITPVGYNPAQNEIRTADGFDIRLEMSGSDPDLTQQMDYRYYNPVFETLLTEKVLNHGAYRSRDYSFPPTTPVSYLILNVADFSAAITPFVEWKTIEGYDVTVEEVPSGATTSTVKAIIQNAYDNWPNPPAYVLLNGDTNTLPAYTGESSGSADDLQYTELEGTGYYTPDVMIGRFPIRSTSDIESILSKTLQWEQTTMPDTNYFQDSVFLASSDHASMLEATHEWCWGNHIQPYDPANNVYHDVYERLGGSTQDFASNVNAGRAFVCYSGHGYGDGSGTASVHFVHSNVSALTNVDKYTHVMVFACGTNLHDQTISFGERWLLEENKGSVSYWGTSDSSYWDEDDYEQREIFRIQNEDSFYSLSAMYLAGLIEVHVQGGSSAYYFDIYNLMGDPSAIFHGRIPMTPTITAAQSTTPNPQDFPVNITDDTGPVQYALVSIYSDGALLGSAYTDASGDALVHIEPAAPGNAVITVTGRNLMTTQRDLMIMAAGCGVAVLDNTLLNCDQTVGVTLWDADLNINPGVVDTAEVDIASDSEPVPEIIMMTETGPDSGEFTGTIMTSDTQSGTGYLLVSDGDVITLHYYDEDCEGSAVDVYDDGFVDCIGPVISGTAVSNVTVESAMIDWTTTEESSTVLVWGETTPPMNELAVPGMTLDHAVTLDGLDSCTQYYFYVMSTDAAGNVAVDDNGGAYYSLTTLELVVMLEANMDTDPGWTYENQWAWGVPLGNDGDPSSGTTGANVVGYNLSGDYTNNMPETFCTTQSFDCSEASEVFLTYYHWLGVESSTWDHASVRVSGNGGSTWTTLWNHDGGSVSPSTWSYAEFDISSVAAGSPDVKVRWVMGTTDSSVTYCGWNIDDVMVSFTRPCTEPTPTPNPCINDGDVTQDGEITAGDAQMAFLIALGSYSPSFEEECAADCNGNGEVTAGDAQAIFMTALGTTSCVDTLIEGTIGQQRTRTIQPAPRIIDDSVDVIWTENVSGSTGDQVTVDVWIDNPSTAIDVFTLSLVYDRAALSLSDVRIGGLDPEWIEFGWNESEDGRVTIAAYNTGMDYDIPAGSFGSLIKLTFSVHRDVPHTAVTLLSVRDDLSGFLLR
ncbi:MAG TPA: C25 family cysteine peptidase, partial [bacterium]|nr:C25 family cysteine peptidase [bacterium]